MSLTPVSPTPGGLDHEGHSVLHRKALERIAVREDKENDLCHKSQVRNQMMKVYEIPQVPWVPKYPIISNNIVKVWSWCPIASNILMQWLDPLWIPNLFVVKTSGPLAVRWSVKQAWLGRSRHGPGRIADRIWEGKFRSYTCQTCTYIMRPHDYMFIEKYMLYHHMIIKRCSKNRMVINITILLSDHNRTRVSLVATEQYYHDMSYDYMSTTCMCVTQWY